MADTFTPNYNLVLPGIGGDVNTWGTLLNGNFSAIDTGMAANLDLAGTRSMTGNLTLKKTNPSVSLIDSSQTLPNGAWRLQSNTNACSLFRNTAVAGDFSTFTIPLTFSATDAMTVLGAATLNSSLTVSGSTVMKALQSTGIVVAPPTGTQGQMQLSQSALGPSSTFLRARENGGFEFINSAHTATTVQADDAGNFTASGNVTAFSDARLKYEWKDVPADIVEMAAQSTAGTYRRKDSGERQAGVIAQEWQSILGEVVSVDDNTGFYTMAYGNAALVLAVALARRVLALEAIIRDDLK